MHRPQSWWLDFGIFQMLGIFFKLFLYTFLNVVSVLVMLASLSIGLFVRKIEMHRFEYSPEISEVNKLKATVYNFLILSFCSQNLHTLALIQK